MAGSQTVRVQKALQERIWPFLWPKGAGVVGQLDQTGGKKSLGNGAFGLTTKRLVYLAVY